MKNKNSVKKYVEDKKKNKEHMHTYIHTKIYKQLTGEPENILENDTLDR